MADTGSRLRRTFRYPTDGDEDDDLPEALDEEEQANLIRNLNLKNASDNQTYRLLFLLIPILSTLPYLRTLLSPPLRLLSLLSLTSLLSTSYLLYILPPGETGILWLDNSSKRSVPASSSSTGMYTHTSHPGTERQSVYGLGSGLMGEDEGPIRAYLPYLNLGLSGVLVVFGVLGKRGREGEGWWWGFEWLPMGVYAFILLAKWIMGSFDPVEELGALKYDYRGA